MNAFIAYRREDSAYAFFVYYALTSEGFSVYIDQKGRKSGPFDERLGKAIKEATYFVLIIGKNSLEKHESGVDWYKKEIDIAFDTRPQNRIIPVLLPGMSWGETMQWKDNWFDYEVYGKLREIECVEVKDVRSFNKCIDDLVGMIDIPLRRDSLAKVLRKSVSDCRAQGILEYILQSRELHMNANCEMHLLTDNLSNYDFSVIAKIAIARNILNGSRYIYYVPDDCTEEYKKLKMYISEYIQGTARARNEQDRWLRKNYLSARATAKRAIRFLKEINGRPLSFFEEIFGDTDMSDILDDFCQYDDAEGVLCLKTENLVAWLKGETDSGSDVDSMLSAIGYVQERLDSNQKREYKDFFRYVADVKTVSEWVRQKDQSSGLETKCSKLCKQYGIDEEIIEWLTTPSNNNPPLDNLILCELPIDRLTSIPCYSFSLFLDANGQTAAGAWYTASSESDSLMGNTVVVHSYSRDELNVVRAVFRELVSLQTDEIRQLVDTKLRKYDKMVKTNQEIKVSRKEFEDYAEKFKERIEKGKKALVDSLIEGASFAGQVDGTNNEYSTITKKIMSELESVVDEIDKETANYHTSITACDGLDECKRILKEFKQKCEKMDLRFAEVLLEGRAFLNDYESAAPQITDKRDKIIAKINESEITLRSKINEKISKASKARDTFVSIYGGKDSAALRDIDKKIDGYRSLLAKLELYSKARRKEVLQIRQAEMFEEIEQQIQKGLKELDKEIV